MGRSHGSRVGRCPAQGPSARHGVGRGAGPQRRPGRSAAGGCHAGQLSAFRVKDHGMTDTSFTDLVQQKIAERCEGRSAAAQAATEADARFRARSAPLVARAMEMMKDLSSAPMFASAIGYPEVSIRREDADGRIGVVSFSGPAGLRRRHGHAPGRHGRPVCDPEALHPGGPHPRRTLPPRP